MLDGNSENCCRKMEKMLFDNLNCNPNQSIEQVLEPRFSLHPIHYLSLKAYIVLFSAYRVQAVNFNSTDLSKDEVSNRFKMARGAAAYSLLAAGATHHLFMSECFIISNTALFFWINAGESILCLARNTSSLHQVGGSRNNCALLESKFALAYECRSHEDLLLVSSQFLKDVSGVVKTLWRYLVEGFSYLELIENPVDFTWLGVSSSHLSYTLDRDETRGKFAEGKGILENYPLYQLAVYCLTYGGFLANICYGSECHLYRKVGDLLDGIL
ncbi:hypothetical protein HPP92_009297 [Vanilla planifolia]|uniref:Uncharacterized protein n=1 Tax=Vanilla planifolia TaxID=51239 RepID=A0A835R7M1_VANPL|nr:hypothetical protein HPP92_009297 [Vanilla planifolia]